MDKKKKILNEDLDDDVIINEVGEKGGTSTVIIEDDVTDYDFSDLEPDTLAGDVSDDTVLTDFDDTPVDDDIDDDL